MLELQPLDRQRATAPITAQPLREGLHSQRGIYIPLLLILLVTIITFAALGVDIARSTTNQLMAQRAADTSVIIGANMIAARQQVPFPGSIWDRAQYYEFVREAVRANLTSRGFTTEDIQWVEDNGGITVRACRQPIDELCINEVGPSGDYPRQVQVEFNVNTIYAFARESLGLADNIVLPVMARAGVQPINAAMLLDLSGSMRCPANAPPGPPPACCTIEGEICVGPKRIDALVQAVESFIFPTGGVRGLDPEYDDIALIPFNLGAFTAVEFNPVANGSGFQDRANKIRAYLDWLRSDVGGPFGTQPKSFVVGATNYSAALIEAYKQFQIASNANRNRTNIAIVFGDGAPSAADVFYAAPRAWGPGNPDIGLPANETSNNPPFAGYDHHYVLTGSNMGDRLALIRQPRRDNNTVPVCTAQAPDPGILLQGPPDPVLLDDVVAMCSATLPAGDVAPAIGAPLPGLFGRNWRRDHPGEPYIPDPTTNPTINPLLIPRCSNRAFGGLPANPMYGDWKPTIESCLSTNPPPRMTTPAVSQNFFAPDNVQPSRNYPIENSTAHRRIFSNVAFAWADAIRNDRNIRGSIWAIGLGQSALNLCGNIYCDGSPNIALEPPTNSPTFPDMPFLRWDPFFARLTLDDSPLAFADDTMTPAEQAQLRNNFMTLMGQNFIGVDRMNEALDRAENNNNGGGRYFPVVNALQLNDTFDSLAAQLRTVVLFRDR